MRWYQRWEYAGDGTGVGTGFDGIECDYIILVSDLNTLLHYQNKMRKTKGMWDNTGCTMGWEVGCIGMGWNMGMGHTWASMGYRTD